MKKLLLNILIFITLISTAYAYDSFDFNDKPTVDLQKNFRQPTAVEMKQSIEAEKAFIFAFRDFMKNEEKIQPLLDASARMHADTSALSKHKVKTLYTQDAYAKSANEITNFIHSLNVPVDAVGDMRDEVFAIFMNNT